WPVAIQHRDGIHETIRSSNQCKDSHVGSTKMSGANASPTRSASATARSLKKGRGHQLMTIRPPSLNASGTTSFLNWALATFVLALLFQASPAWAQSPLPDLSLEDLMKLDAGQVFGASERLQPATEAPATVSFITSEE